MKKLKIFYYVICFFCGKKEQKTVIKYGDLNCKMSRKCVPYRLIEYSTGKNKIKSSYTTDLKDCKKFFKMSISGTSWSNFFTHC